VTLTSTKDNVDSDFFSFPPIASSFSSPLTTDSSPRCTPFPTLLIRFVRCRHSSRAELLLSLLELFRWLVCNLPTGLNMAWLCIVGFAQLEILVVSMEKSSTVSDSWGVAFVALTCLFFVGMMIYSQDLVPPAVAIWGLAAIAINDTSTAMVVCSSLAAALLAVCSLGCLVVVMFFVIRAEQGFARSIS